MAVRPNVLSNPMVGEPRAVVDDNVAPVSQNPRSGVGTSIVSPNPVDTVPKNLSVSNPIVDDNVAPVSQNPRSGTSIVDENPVGSIPRTPSVVPTTTSTAVVSGVLVDAYSSKPIVVATPNVISDAVNQLAGTFGGGGGGGLGSTEETIAEDGTIVKKKKPDYLVFGLIVLGAYLIFKAE
jgi:hypothetical protein